MLVRSMLGVGALMGGTSFGFGQAVSVDGTRDYLYGSPRVWQTLQTEYGNNTLTTQANDGSELVAAYSYIGGGHLNLFFAGNLQTNGNKIYVFLDTQSGSGQNRLRGDNNGISALLRLGDSGGPNGFQFETGFDADHAFVFNAGDGSNLFVDYSTLPTSSGGAHSYLGSSALGASSGTLSGGTNLLGVLTVLRNGNTVGVASGNAGGQIPQVGPSGLELSIPLSSLGIVDQSVKVIAFVGNGSGDHLSNQFLPDLNSSLATTSAVSNLGEPRGKSLAAILGTQFFYVQPRSKNSLIVNRLNNAAGSSSVTLMRVKPGVAGTDISDIANQVLLLPGNTPGAQISMVSSKTASGHFGKTSDGRSLALGGFGTAAGSPTGTANSTVALVNHDLSVVFRNNALTVDPRTAAAFDSGLAYLGGDSRILYATTTSASIATPNARAINLFNNRVYYSTATTIGAFSTLVTSAATATTVVNPLSAHDFVFADPRTLYVACETSPTAIQRFVYNGTTWSESGSIPRTETLNVSVRGIALTKDSLDRNVFFVVTNESNPRVIQFTEGIGDATVLMASTSSYLVRGIDWTPELWVAPVANADSNSTNEDTPVNGNVLTNDTGEVVGGAELVSAVSPPEAGSAIVNPNGSYTFTPALNYSGPASFTYRFTDGDTYTSPATVSITVNPLNDDPALDPVGNRTVDEEGTLEFTLGSTDVDGGPPIYALGANPHGGTLSGSLFTWTPTEEQGPGDYSFTFTVSDGAGGSDVETITIHVNEVNETPVLAAIPNQTVAATQELTFSVSGADPNDIPANALAYSLVGAPIGASIDPGTGVFSWTPVALQIGVHNFTVRVTDDGTPNLSADQPVQVTVTANNTPPVASNANFTTDEGTPVATPVIAADADEDELTYSIVTPPANGVISGTGPNWTYTPNGVFSGADSFTFKANDGNADSNTATVGITVNDTIPMAIDVKTSPAPNYYGSIVSYEGWEARAIDRWMNANGAPELLRSADPTAFETPSEIVWSDTTVTNFPFWLGVLNPSAPFGSELGHRPTFTTRVLGQGTRFSLAGLEFDISSNDPALDGGDVANMYGWSGWWDGTDPGDPGQQYYNPWTIGIDYGTDRIRGTSDDEVYQAGEVAELYIDELVYVGLGYGFEAVTGGSVTDPAVALMDTRAYLERKIAATGSQVDISITFRIRDGGHSDPLLAQGTQVLPLVSNNVAPTAFGSSTSVDENSVNNPISVTPATDPNSFEVPLTYEVVVPPAHGTLSGTGPNWTYTPAPGNDDDVSFTYRVKDVTLNSNTETVSIAVNSVNTAPVANDDYFDATEDTQLVVPVASGLRSNDTDNGPISGLAVSVVSPPSPAQGTVMVQPDGSFVFAPAENFFGPCTFTYRVNDGSLNSNVATVTIDVEPVNDPPILDPVGNRSIGEGSILIIPLGGNDVDSTILTFASNNLPDGATLVDNTFSWIPTEAQGPDDYEFTFEVSDGSGGVDTETVTISVGEVNEPPTLAEISEITADEMTLVSFSAIGDDIDLPANSLTFSLMGAPSGASIDETTGDFTWTPTEAQGPNDYTFTVRVSDGLQHADRTVTVHVIEANVAPSIATIDDIVANEQTAITFAAVGSDTDLPAQTLNYSLVGAPAGATIDDDTGEFSWTPTEAQGPQVYTFAVRVSDGQVHADEAVQITVNEVNVPPVATGQSLATQVNTALPITLMATDVDLPANALNFVVVDGPLHGSLSGTNQNLIYTPNPGHTGADSFTFRANDGTADSNIETININVAGTTITLNLTLQGFAGLGPTTRGMTMYLGGTAGGSNPPVNVSRDVVFDATGHATVVFVPSDGFEPTDDLATYAISVKDDLHSLRKLAMLQWDGDNYDADATLVGGNVNRDGRVDIGDYVVYAVRYGTTPGADTPLALHFNPLLRHADMSGDGVVDGGDFSFISANFGFLDEALPGNYLRGPGAIRRRMTVQEAVNEAGTKRAADLDRNRDGWISMQEAMQPLAP